MSADTEMIEKITSKLAMYKRFPFEFLLIRHFYSSYSANRETEIGFCCYFDIEEVPLTCLKNSPAFFLESDVSLGSTGDVNQES